MSRVSVVFVTCGTKKEAAKIAVDIVKRKLAACVNTLDVKQSVYMWQGKLCKDKEVLMIIKAPTRNLKRLESRIKKLHSYDCPEIISFSVSRGNKDYLAWVINSCN